MPKPITFCKNHPAIRSHARGLCTNCYSLHLRSSKPGYKDVLKQRHRKWFAKNTDKAKSYAHEYYHKHAEHLKNKARKRWNDLSPNERWEKNLKSTYGVNAADYAEMLEKQNGACAICLKPQRGRLFVDHSRLNGSRVRGKKYRFLVRGLLCGRCNSLAGWIEMHRHHINKVLNYIDAKIVSPR